MQRKTMIKISIPIGIVSILIIGMFSYLGTYYKAKNVSEYLLSSDKVKIERKNDVIIFDNKENNEDAFIFYPGAKVDEKAYAPILRKIADAGIDVYLCAMPFHFAIFDINAADKVFNKTSYTSYFIGGHSLGGAMASNYVAKTKNEVKGIVYFASFSSTSLKEKEIKALSIYGTEDGVLNMDKAKANIDNFKSGNYKEVIIDGGNHAQFGSYGKQKKDKKATISLEEQTMITSEAVISYIKTC